MPAHGRHDMLKRERPESFPACLRDGPVLVAPLELVLVWGFYSSIRCQSKIPFFIKIDVCALNVEIDVCALNVEGKQVPREQSVLGRQRFCGCFWGVFTE